MLNAIHKKTGKRVQADKLQTDASWIGCKSDEWIAPIPEVSNWDELKARKIFEVNVSYIKAHESQRDGKFYEVRDHFRITTEGAKDKSENESEEHKLAKEGVYYNLLDDGIDLIFGNINVKPSSLGNFSLEIEERLSHNKTAKIGDVVLTFEIPHDILGKGIVFEIQLSNQTIEKTEERTYDRIKQGYSVVWMWDGMFSSNKLINPKLSVIPFRTALDEYDQSKIEEVNNLGRVIDDKLLEMERIQKENLLRMEIIHDEQMSKFEKSQEFIRINAGNELREEYNKFIKTRVDEIYENVLSSIRDNINIDEEKIKKIIHEEAEIISKNLLENSEELVEIENVVKGNIKMAVKEYSIKINKEIDSKILKAGENAVASNGYQEGIKKQFSMDLAAFARTYLDAKIYDLKDEIKEKLILGYDSQIKDLKSKFWEDFRERLKQVMENEKD